MEAHRSLLKKCAAHRNFEHHERTYRALKKNSSQVKTGRTGRKNCLVTGMRSASISNDAAPVLTSGPGA
jgi:hypothetical protein